MPIQVKRVQLKLKDGDQYKDGDLLFNVDAQAWATGKRNGQTIVDVNDHAYHNNALYYKDQAAGYADQALQNVLTGNLAPEFDAAQSYSEGDYVIHNGKLWCFTANHTGAWDDENEDAEEKLVSDIIEDLISDINYNPIAINTFTSSTTKAEIGSTINEVTLTYNLNKMPATLTLDGTAITAAASGTQSLTNLGLTSNKTWTLVATDSGSSSNPSSSATKTATLSFMYKVFWGAATIPAQINSAFIRGLSNSALTTTKARDITVDTSSNKYVWYAVPTSFGNCTFTYDGFSGGFEDPQTISVKDAGENNVSYQVYRSTNNNLNLPSENITIRVT